MSKEYHEFTCTIHNIEVKVGKHKAHEIASCPYCLKEKLLRTVSQAHEAAEHRDALLRAFEIKQTVEHR